MNPFKQPTCTAETAAEPLNARGSHPLLVTANPEDPVNIYNVPRVAIQNTPSGSDPGPVIFLPLTQVHFSQLIRELITNHGQDEAASSPFVSLDSSNAPLIISLMIEQTSTSALHVIQQILWDHDNRSRRREFHPNLTMALPTLVTPGKALSPEDYSYPSGAGKKQRWMTNLSYPLLFEVLVALDYLDLQRECTHVMRDLLERRLLKCGRRERENILGMIPSAVADKVQRWMRGDSKVWEDDCVCRYWPWDW